MYMMRIRICYLGLYGLSGLLPQLDSTQKVHQRTVGEEVLTFLSLLAVRTGKFNLAASVILHETQPALIHFLSGSDFLK